jgi:hypothetical protein
VQPAIHTLFLFALNTIDPEKVNPVFPDIGFGATSLAGRELVLFLSQQRIPAVV